MKITTLDALYVDMLKELFEAETLLVRALPKMAKSATTPQLREALAEHLHQTQTHVHRLDQIFLRLGWGSKGSACRIMEGLIAESKDLMSDEAKPTVLDVALIVGLQRIVHYVMAGYGSLRPLATQLGHTKAAALLQESLTELQAADATLTNLADVVMRSGAGTPKSSP